MLLWIETHATLDAWSAHLVAEATWKKKWWITTAIERKKMTATEQQTTPPTDDWSCAWSRSQLQTWNDCPSFSCQQNTKDWGLVPFLFFINHDKKRNAPRTPFPQHTLLVLHILTTVEAPVFGTVYLVFKWTNRNYKLLHTLSTICWSEPSFHDSRWRGQYGLSTVFCNEHRLSCSSLIGIQHTLFLHRQHLHFSFSISQWWF